MIRISGQILIDAPVEKVWAVLADLTTVQNYSPGVAAARYTSRHHEGLDARRHCDLRPKGHVEERIVAWQDGEAYTIEIYDGSLPLREAFGHFSLTPEGQGTAASFTMEYKLKFGPVGGLLDVLVVRRQFRKSVSGILAGLKHYVETGEPVGVEEPGRAQAMAA